MGQSMFFRCRQPRHFARECPQGVDSTGRPQAEDRVFTLSREEAHKLPEMIRDTVTVNGYLVDTLFDSDTSHSFISYDCARCLGLAYAHCYTMLDLICMPFCDIDIVLSLNWLSSQNVLLDCKNKTLILPTRELTLTAKVKLNVILVAQADRWLRQGCQSYIVFFSRKAETKEGILDIPVVQEFPEVFPTKISGLPPKREIEFAIDLVPRTSSISKAPYRMAPNEMTELEKQLEKLSGISP
ncbi:uncharacterized protein LOC114715283 [Neltuma alba]|uniref:uncharacterized protein LOC114715283 n=1 Tax=Neltuma alba TaxID=207710 RepID=UPI0010A56025|nr:uncharacterized protein LOC114715283 [Prosopis alba]